MPMRKKDYDLIGAILKRNKPRRDHYNKIEAHATAYYKWNQIVTHLASALAKANPRFDQKQFLAGCGYGKEIDLQTPAWERAEANLTPEQD